MHDFLCKKDTGYSPLSGLLPYEADAVEIPDFCDYLEAQSCNKRNVRLLLVGVVGRCRSGEWFTPVPVVVF